MRSGTNNGTKIHQEKLVSRVVAFSLALILSANYLTLPIAFADDTMPILVPAGSQNVAEVLGDNNRAILFGGMLSQLDAASSDGAFGAAYEMQRQLAVALEQAKQLVGQSAFDFVTGISFGLGAAIIFLGIFLKPNYSNSRRDKVKSVPRPSSQRRLRGISGKNKRWIALYITILVLWGVVFLVTMRSWVGGSEALVDDLDISFYTFPFLIFNLIFVGTTFLMFGIFFVYYQKAIREQKEAKKKMSHSESERADQDPKKLEDQKEELVSIIIPARNEENVIKTTITNCLRQSYKKIEVIVVCHNCTDSTYEQAKTVADERVRCLKLDTKESGKGIALNDGVQMSDGKYLLILDGDGRLSENFIEDAMPLFAAGDYAAVQGRYVPSNRGYNFITRMLALEGDLWSTPFMTLRGIGTKRVSLGGTGYIIRKDILQKVGFFKNHLVDDYELTFRLLRQRYRIAFAPLSINYDEKPPNLDIMLKQRGRWLKGFFQLLKIRVAEPTDIIGNMYWVNPITTFTGLALLLVAAFSTIHYLAFLYYPYTFSYIPLTTWIALTLSLLGVYTAALVMQYGRTGLRYAAWLPIYIPFSNYYMVVALKAFFIKSWAETKTVHGFVPDSGADLQQPILKEKS